jgi:hypothetical protein
VDGIVTALVEGIFMQALHRHTEGSSPLVLVTPVPSNAEVAAGEEQEGAVKRMCGGAACVVC